MFDSWNTNPQTPGKSLISVLKVVIFVLWLIFGVRSNVLKALFYWYTVNTVSL